jgi:hypothetical protein
VHAEAGDREIALGLLRQRRSVLEQAMIGEAA